MINICCSASNAGGATRRNSAITGDVLPAETERRLSPCWVRQLSVVHRHRVNVSSLPLFSGMGKDLDHNAAEFCSSRRVLHLNVLCQKIPARTCLERAGADCRQDNESEGCQANVSIGAGASLHCGAQAACPEPSTGLSQHQQAQQEGQQCTGQAEFSTLTIRVSWLNAPTFCSAVNNSCS